MVSKKCKTCLVVRAVDEFHKDRSQSDGLYPHCKSCKKVRNRKHYLAKKEERCRKQREYRKNNLERCREAGRRNYRNNRERYMRAAEERRCQILAVTVEKIDRKIVYTRDHGVCQLCGRSVSFEKMTLDHVVPVAKGGEHSYANVQTSHATCNKRKHVKTMSEYLSAVA